MISYRVPVPAAVARTPANTVYTIVSGDLRTSANVTCWPTQQKLESDLTAAVTSFGWQVQRGHEIDPAKGHGFIDSQRAGIEVFRSLPADAPLIVVEAVWQYSHHVLAGLRSHRGPILVVANWDGKFPGLVGLLNLAASLTKAGIALLARCGARTSPTSGRARGCGRWLETGELDS